MVKRPHKYPFLRDQRWHYQRNVPKKFRHIEPRKRIRVALHTNRIKIGDDSGERPTPYTANRHIGNMRTLYREYYAYCGQEDRPNPFRSLSFKEDRNSKSKRAPFETDGER